MSVRFNEDFGLYEAPCFWSECCLEEAWEKASKSESVSGTPINFSHRVCSIAIVCNFGIRLQ
jgi:hypothetical protein